MTSKEIDKALRSHFQNNSRYMVSNVYPFDSYYKEIDFLVVKENGIILDIEIKVTRADFKAYFKKKKHEILRNGYITLNHFSARTETTGLVRYEAGEKINIDTPNRFYFCVPENLISVDDPLLPDYAGLLYVTEFGGIRKIKEAKLLHKEKKLKEIESVLCRKFYYSYLTLKEKSNGNNMDI